MTAVVPAQPTTAQLVSAFAAALLPLAGPYGVAASGVMTAGLQLLSQIQAEMAAGKTVFSMADLATMATKTGVDLSKLVADANAAQ